MPHRMHRMRWRIAGAYLALIVTTLALLALVSLDLLRTTYLRTLEAGVAGQGRLLAALVAGQLDAPGPRAALAAAARSADERLDARVTIIAPDGAVLADSLTSDATGNLAARPEVQEALRLGQGADERYSTATGDDRLYVAVPIGPPGSPQGVVRIGVPLTTIADAQRQLATVLLATALTAAAVTVVLAMVIAGRTTQPLLDLRAMAGRLAAGDLEVQVPIPRDEEVAALAQDFNLMASRLRRLLHDVEAERQRLAAVLATMADGIAIVDQAGAITLLNRAARVATRSDDSLPVPLARFPLGDGLSAAVQRARWAPRDALPVSVDELTVPATGRQLRALVTRLPAPEDDHALVVLQDLSDLRRAERSRRALLSNIAHDLRTPLASLQAIVETLQAGAIDDPDAAPDFLRRMDAEVQGMTRLVNDVLELSRIESGELPLEPAPADLADIARVAVARMQAQARQRGLSLTLALPPLLPALTLDASRIEQALLNVIQNAIAFTPRGGTITVGAAVDADGVALWVRDTGVGVAPEHLPHLFERFYKADPSRSGGGSGLGLAIVKHLVERHGGQVAVASAPGAGTAVTMRFPQPTLQPAAR